MNSCIEIQKLRLSIAPTRLQLADIRGQVQTLSLYIMVICHPFGKDYGRYADKTFRQQTFC